MRVSSRLITMKHLTKLFAFLLLICVIVGSFSSCELFGKSSSEEEGTEIQEIDYVSQLKLDRNSGTLQQEVTVKTFVDGDTTHFDLTSPIDGSNVVKARYLAIDTPESTGKIEEWGKKASKFTRSKLENATSIIIESDNATWNVDSTGGRYMLWIWYLAPDATEYRNLNLEILQNGLAVASKTAQNRYGETCMAALNQAKLLKLHVFSNDKDPDFPYGEATELTLRELRSNVEAYNGAKVAFTGVITRIYSNTAYVESYDAETGLYFGMPVYYGFNLNGDALKILTVGNEVRIVGSVQFYETGGTYQVAGLTYKPLNPDHPDCIKTISQGNKAAYTLTDAAKFATGEETLVVGEENVTFGYAALSLSTSISMENLTVKSIYTTNNEDSSSNGAMTLTCEVNGVTISVRTVVLTDAEGNLITADTFEGETIDVKGLVDYYDGKYQIKVFSMNDVTFH